MKILTEDGLGQHIFSIKSPTNEHIIEAMSGKISLFSIINDYTTPVQFKDADIIQGFASMMGNFPCVDFDKKGKSRFIIVHSQCSVSY